jgi:hypothetical protein
VRFSIKFDRDSSDVTGGAIDGEDEIPEDEGSLTDSAFDCISLPAKIPLYPGMIGPSTGVCFG